MRYCPNVYLHIHRRKAWGDIDNSSKSALRHVQWTVNEKNNMNAVLFPTRIRPLCRLRTHLSCSYTWNIITRIAGCVVVSASNWQAGRPGLIRADAAAGLIYLVWKIDGQGLTLLNIIGTIRHAHWHASCIKCTQLSHRPLHHNKTVVLCVYMMTTYGNSYCIHWNIEKEDRRKGPPPSLPRSTASPSWNLTSPETKTARLPYCRDVTVRMLLPVSRHYYAAQPNAGKRYLFL